MTPDQIKLARRSACYPTFAADQALASVRARLGELFSVRDRMIYAAKNGTLPLALDDLTPQECLAILAAVQFAGFSAVVAGLHQPFEGDSNDSDPFDDGDFQPV